VPSEERHALLPRQDLEAVPIQCGHGEEYRAPPRPTREAKVLSVSRTPLDSLRSDGETGHVSTVFLVDDHEVVRQGLRRLLEADGGFQVVGEAATAAEARARIPALRPDVAVLDVRLPDGDGVTLCRDIRSAVPEVACLMLTSFADDEALAAAVLAGASGYVLKEVRGRDLVERVRAVAAGEQLLDRATVERQLEALRRRPGDPAARALEELTPREREILELIGRGRTNRQIAAELYLAEKTVKNYVSNLLAKLGMARRTEVAALAARLDERRSHPGT
jgi:two-component system response regulator DevR